MIKNIIFFIIFTLLSSNISSFNHNNYVYDETINIEYSISNDTVRNNSDIRQQCQASTQSGAQCKRLASPGEKYCWQHKNNTKSHKSPKKSLSNTERCKAITKKGTRCSRTATASGYCWQHSK